MKIKGKYDLFLTVFLIIIFVALAVTLGPYLYNEAKSEIKIREALKDFDEKTANSQGEDINNGEISDNIEENAEGNSEKGSIEDILNEIEKANAEKNSSSSKNTDDLRNYATVGKIEIPKTNINYPVYEQIARVTLEAGVAIAYGPGLNQSGNTVIYGHNFRNGKFFSNNKKLVSGDKIYISDLDGNRLEYRIYSVYYTTPTDANYMVRDTEGKREISLQTCSDDNSRRLIVWATAD